MEHVVLNQAGTPSQLSGQVLLEDQQGGLLLKTDEGAIWPIESQSITRRSSSDRPLVPLDKEQLAERLLDELGPGFQVHDSKHYVVCFNTTRTYAKWTSSLLERLQKAFIAYWKKQGSDVHEPEAPLAVLIFANKASYVQHAKTELGPAAGSAIGYYSVKTNRIVMFDLTGMQSLRRQYSRRGSLHDITAMLSQPEAVPLVATIVHEATHQIAFNCGLQTRFSFPPVWLSEGLAVYFETPDLSSNRSWRANVGINYPRWDRFRQNVNNGRDKSLQSMVADDSQIRDPRTAVDAYAQAWAWNYYLIRFRRKEYTAYLKTLADKPLLIVDDEKTRLADFRKHFGDDLESIEAAFYKRMSKIE